MALEDPGSMRAVLRSFLPWFHKADRSGRISGAIGKALDATLQAALDAVFLRFPSVCPGDALALLGQDRRIPRAPGEDHRSYRRRLLLWLDYWSHAGLPLGLLYAVQSFVFPGYPRVRYVSRSGYWYTLDQGASAVMSPFEAVTLPTPPPPGFAVSPYRYTPALEATPRAPFWCHVADPKNWDYDSQSNPERGEYWWDFWLIVYPPAYQFQGNYDDDVFYDSETCWGLAALPGVFDVMRALVKTYKRAGATCRGILFAPTLDDFDPYAAPGAPGMPDGWWGQEVRLVGGEWVGTRRDDVRYVDV